MRIKWFGHASFEIETGGSMVYIDPYVLPEGVRKADLVLITHEHFGHCDEEALRKVEKTDTLLITTDRAARKLGREAKVVGVGDEVMYESILVRAVPAYMTDSEHHPRGHGVGYLIEAEGKRVYYAGDTDHIPEMRLIDEVSVAILPVGGPHAMAFADVVRVAQLIQPEILVPMHFGHMEGSTADIIKLKSLVESVSHTRVEDLTHGELHI